MDRVSNFGQLMAGPNGVESRRDTIQRENWKPPSYYILTLYFLIMHAQLVSVQQYIRTIAAVKLMTFNKVYFLLLK